MTVQTMDFDWPAAAESGRKAAALAPVNATITTNLMFLAFARGDCEETIAQACRTVELDPVSAEAHVWLVFAYLWADQFEEAELEARRVIELSPVALWSYAGLALTFLLAGRIEEAAHAAGQEKEDYSRLTTLALAEWGRGRREASDAALDGLIKVGSAVAAYQIAWAYAYRGDADATFRWLDRAYLQRDAGLLVLPRDPFFRPLHADPRWSALLSRMRMQV